MHRLSNSTLRALGRKLRLGFVLVEVMVGGAILVAFALAAGGAMTMMNRTAAVNRNQVAAQAVVRDYILQTLAAEYTSSTSSPLLTLTAAGADVDGDGEGDGVAHATNVPVLYNRDTVVAGVQTSALTGTLYRHCIRVDATLNVARVTFLLRYTYLNRVYTYRMTTFRAQDR